MKLKTMLLKDPDHERQIVYYLLVLFILLILGLFFAYTS